MPKRLDAKNLRNCIRYYTPKSLFIRSVGSMGADVKVRENLHDKTLGFKKVKSGLHMLIGGTEVFCFSLKQEYLKGFSLEYERFEQTEDGVGRMVMLSAGVNPYDPNLPEPAQSFLRTVLDGHLMEISFVGRVHLRFHSWWKEPHWKYWVVVKPDDVQITITKQETEYTDDDAGNSHS